MKTFLCLIASVAVTTAVVAQVRPSSHRWQATIKVVDETGQPVPGAQVIIGFAVPPPPDESTASDKITGLSDTNGMFTASHTDRSVYLSFQARKAGHYSFGIQHELGFSPQDHPEWLTPNATLVLKRIIKPVAMYAKWVSKPVPVSNEPIGYDLMAGDWVAPRGKGSHTDMIFTAYRDQRSENDFDYRLVVNFPKLGDGIQEFSVSRLPVGEGSGLRSTHEAPASGYHPEWNQTRTRRPGQPVRSNRDDNRNYFFRVRTVLDENGNVKSAHYGKIYGDFMQFRYYLNPTPNDRNLEFDPKQNLLKGLKSTEQVREP